MKSVRNLKPLTSTVNGCIKRRNHRMYVFSLLFFTKKNHQMILFLFFLAKMIEWFYDLLKVDLNGERLSLSLSLSIGGCHWEFIFSGELFPSLLGAPAECEIPLLPLPSPPTPPLPFRPFPEVSRVSLPRPTRRGWGGTLFGTGVHSILSPD